jgi:putative membrane protein
MDPLNPLFVSNIVAAIVFAALGIVTFVVAFWVMDRLTPYDLWKEIIEEHNTALAVLIGFMALAMSVIIAAAIH